MKKCFALCAFTALLALSLAACGSSAGSTVSSAVSKAGSAVSSTASKAASKLESGVDSLTGPDSSLRDESPDSGEGLSSAPNKE